MYSVFIHIYAFLIRLGSLRIRKARLMVQGHKQTFSILEEKIEMGASYIWFHVSSLGEFEQGRPLIEAIKKRNPEQKILLTFFSPSGYEVRKDYPLADVVCYLPIDTKRNAQRFVNMVKPAMVIFVKYDLWPNYLKTVAAANIPAYLVSAIFRKEQLYFQPYGKWFRSVLRCFKQIFVQDEASLALLNKIGITTAEKCGDTRFDRVLSIREQAMPLPLIESFVEDVPFVIVAGSTWPPDEDVLLPYLLQKRKIKIILAPHEIDEEHLQAIEERVGKSVIRYSRLEGAKKANYRCLIIDCFGLLSSIYRYGSVAYVGGGFGAGIHNSLEAAVHGVPLVFGPNYEKFKEARDLIENGGAKVVKDELSLTYLLGHLKEDAADRAAMGDLSAGYVKANAGATEHIMNVISSEL